MSTATLIEPPDLDFEAPEPSHSETRNYRVLCLSEALSPITHMQGASGNESIVAREPLITPRGVMMAPYLSGNAIRHRVIRAPGMRWLIDRYGLAGKLTLPQLNFLNHGGSLTEGGGRENTARIAEFQRLWPLGRLLGGCLPDQILSGSLHAWRGSLVCQENRSAIQAELSDADLLPARLRPAEAFVSGYQYTRGDAAKTLAPLATQESRDEAGESPSNLMIYSGQAVTRGAMFAHGFVLIHASILELGALLWSIRLWQSAGGTIGGQSARGHGRLKTSLVGPLDFDPIEAERAYIDYALSVRDEAVAWLHDVFAPRATKAKAKAKSN